jgi:hypothetical protein
MTLERLVILNPSTVTLSPSDPVILSTFAPLSVNSAKDLILLRVDSAKSLRTSSVKDLWHIDPLPSFLICHKEKREEGMRGC